MNSDAYEGFADRYDLFISEFGEHNPAEVEFFQKLFTDNNVHKDRDCACGTGQHLHLLKSLGYKVRLWKKMLSQVLMRDSESPISHLVEPTCASGQQLSTSGLKRNVNYQLT